MSTPAGYALALILFFGRGRGRGGRATAKPTDSRRTSADGFAVRMERTKAGGRVVKSCSPFSAVTIWIGGMDITTDCLHRENLLYLGKQIKRKFVREHNGVKKLLKWKERSIK